MEAEAVARIEGPTPIRISVGVAHLDAPTPADTARHLVAQADARLYERKRLLACERVAPPRGQPVR